MKNLALNSANFAKKFIFGLCAFASTALANYNADRMLQDTQIWDANRIINIANYSTLGKLWTTLQGEYIATIALIALICVLAAFALHYMIIGPKQFSHHGKKIFAFSLFERSFHFIAALSWVILLPTGLVMMFGSYFGGGVFVRVCKNLHAFSSLLFIIAIFPMLFCWFRRMLPAKYDLKWLLIVGGYLHFFFFFVACYHRVYAALDGKDSHINMHAEKHGAQDTQKVVDNGTKAQKLDLAQTKQALNGC